jgi:hypothetical protein
LNRLSEKKFAGHTLEAQSSCKNWLNSENFNFFIKLKFGVKKILKFSTAEIPKTFFFLIAHSLTFPAMYILSQILSLSFEEKNGFSERGGDKIFFFANRENN